MVSTSVAYTQRTFIKYKIKTCYIFLFEEMWVQTFMVQRLKSFYLLLESENVKDTWFKAPWLN